MIKVTVAGGSIGELLIGNIRVKDFTNPQLTIEFDTAADLKALIDEPSEKKESTSVEAPVQAEAPARVEESVQAEKPVQVEESVKAEKPVQASKKLPDAVEQQIDDMVTSYVVEEEKKQEKREKPVRMIDGMTIDEYRKAMETATLVAEAAMEAQCPTKPIETQADAIKLCTGTLKNYSIMYPSYNVTAWFKEHIKTHYDGKKSKDMTMEELLNLNEDLHKWIKETTDRLSEENTQY